MVAEGSSKGRPRKKSRKRVLKLVLLLFVVVAVLVIILLPVIVSSQWCRRIVLDKINRSIDGEVYFGGLSMSWWEGVKVADFSFKDGAGQTFVEIKQVAARPHYGSILTGHFSFGEALVDEPRIQINPAARQAAADSRFGAEQEGGEGGVIALPVEEIELVVNNGSLKVAGGTGEAVEAEGISSKLALKFVGGHPAAGVRELLANLEAKAQLRVEQAECMGFRIGSAEADVRIDDGLVRIASFSSIVNNGRLNFAGEADLKQEPVLFRTAGPIQVVEGIEITDEVTRRFLAYLNPVFANAVNVSGVVDVSCERLSVPIGGGSGDDIEVIGTVSISRLRLQASDLLGEIFSLVGVAKRGQDIIIEPTRFLLQDGLLRYDDMQMVVGDNPISFRGAIGLDRSLDMRVVLPYTTSGETVRIGEEAEGVRITIPLKGTIDRPELDTGKLLGQQLKEHLRERLEEQLEEQLREEMRDRLLESLEGLIKP